MTVCLSIYSIAYNQRDVAFSMPYIPNLGFFCLCQQKKTRTLALPPLLLLMGLRADSCVLSTRRQRKICEDVERLSTQPNLPQLTALRVLLLKWDMDTTQSHYCSLNKLEKVFLCRRLSAVQYFNIWSVYVYKCTDCTHSTDLNNALLSVSSLQYICYLGDPDYFFNDLTGLCWALVSLTD